MGGQRLDVREVSGSSFIIKVQLCAINVVNTEMDFCFCKCVVVLEAELAFIFVFI